ncbi:MAG: hypothetical protein HY319_25580 [Armatimonadetes bacterium]|nr:hypothetical protein [Armatimonadota bacterium]
MDQEIATLKAQVDLVEVMRSSGLELKKKGQNWFARCPWHPDQEASLSVNPKAQLYNCFSCQEGGDVLTFLQKREELSLPQAIELLRSTIGQLPGRYKATLTNGTNTYNYFYTWDANGNMTQRVKKLGGDPGDPRLPLGWAWPLTLVKKDGVSPSRGAFGLGDQAIRRPRSLAILSKTGRSFRFSDGAEATAVNRSYVCCGRPWARIRR